MLMEAGGITGEVFFGAEFEEGGFKERNKNPRGGVGWREVAICFKTDLPTCSRIQQERGEMGHGRRVHGRINNPNNIFGKIDFGMRLKEMEFSPSFVKTRRGVAVEVLTRDDPESSCRGKI